MDITKRKKMLNRIKKRIDIVFLYERTQGRGIGDVWDKISVILDREKEKIEEDS